MSAVVSSAVENVSREQITELREPALSAYEAEFLPITRDYRAESN
ncbi:hypothetical protein [Saccharothrix sp. Mg75]